MSCTFTLKVVGVAVLPAASAAVQVTVVSPNANVDPDTGVQFAIPSPSTMSLVAGEVYVTTAPANEVASIGLTSAWKAMIGAVVSCTVTLKVAGVASLL